MNNKSFVNWIGNKYNIREQIINHFPNKYNNYFEPFVGSGIIFFNAPKQNSILIDSNVELVNTYNIIKNNPEELLDLLLSFEINEFEFESLKNLDREDDYLDIDNIYKAARFIYINLNSEENFYHVNNDGLCINKYKIKNKKTINFETFYQCNFLLQKANILCENYDYILNLVQENDLVYLDPPYDGNFFFHYNNHDKFKQEEQIKLKEFCDKLNEKKVFFVLSNSKTNFIKSLYINYNLYDIKELKRIELIIKNF